MGIIFYISNDIIPLDSSNKDFKQLREANYGEATKLFLNFNLHLVLNSFGVVLYAKPSRSLKFTTCDPKSNFAYF